MRVEKISPKEIIPLEAPHRRDTVESLREVYEDPKMQDALDSIVPYVFVHFVKKDGLYMVDGHHRTGVAHMYDRGVNAIFLNTFRDLQDAYVLRDLELIPKFDFGFPIDTKLPHFSRDLPAAHRSYALPRGVRTFDDFVEKIRKGEYHSTKPKLSLSLSL
tara:strand:- start:130 stop:609 length:480 start_codon:yes stop_codon:yes gene_type:complete